MHRGKVLLHVELMVMSPARAMTPARALSVMALECFLVLIAIGAVLQVGPLRRARTIVHPSCDVIRVVGAAPGTASPRAPIVGDSVSALCLEVRYGLAAVLVLLPVIFPLQVLYGLRKSGESRTLTP